MSRFIFRRTRTPRTPAPRTSFKLKLVERDKTSAWYRTEDGKFDVLGGDLNTNTRAGRAAGAGAVWSWRPAKPTSVWTDDMHSFATKAGCVADLDAHIAREAAVSKAAGFASYRCQDCGYEYVSDDHVTLTCPQCKSENVYSYTP